MPELEGKTVLITGSGSLGGIGADTALLFAQQGAEVLVSGRHTERGQRVVDTILRAGAQLDSCSRTSPVLTTCRDWRTRRVKSMSS
jgi:NAD(P)-dependent dehydrogenase (short-subunit alcohol dehydrogenase family)